MTRREDAAQCSDEEDETQAVREPDSPGGAPRRTPVPAATAENDPGERTKPNMIMQASRMSDVGRA